MKLLVLLLLVSESSFASIKIRAREHYEIHKVKNKGLEGTYKGFSNTINVWYEKPFKYSLGLALSPLIATSKHSKGDDSLGSWIRVVNIGLEYKVFPHEVLKNTFTRLGLGYGELQSDQGAKDLPGYNYYFGIGYEFPISDIGLALEYGYRYSKYKEDKIIQSLIPSIGVHFYKLI